MRGPSAAPGVSYSPTNREYELDPTGQWLSPKPNIEEDDVVKSIPEPAAYISPNKLGIAPTKAPSTLGQIGAAIGGIVGGIVGAIGGLLGAIGQALGSVFGGGRSGGSSSSGSSNSGSNRGSSSMGGYGDGSGNRAGWAGKPILLDLSGKGLSIDTLGSSQQFIDLDGSGYQHRTAWAGDGTGVLVLDADGDGKISRSSEFMFTEWDPTAQTDLEAIKNIFDTNQNGLLDAGDLRWADFKVMVNGQLVSLDSLGIASIGLTPKGSERNFEDGSAITGVAEYTKTDGTTGAVGDAVLSVDPNGYVIKTVTTANPDGSKTVDLTGYNKGGTVAFRNRTVTSADGQTKTTQFDDDGNGTWDRSQTDVTTLVAGERQRVISNFNADGSLADRITTLTSADGKTVTTSLDQDGDGNTDQTQVYVSNADGSSTTTISQFAVDGTLQKKVSITASGDGLSKTTKTDSTGSGIYELIVSETTLVGSDGSRTKTIERHATDGSLISRESTVTSADGRIKTVSRDLDGNGVFETRDESTIGVDANGVVTTTVSTYSGTNVLIGKTVATQSADGLTKTQQADLDGNGTIDLVGSDTTVVAADGTRTRTEQTNSANGTLLGQTATTTSADNKSISIVSDSNGDGKTDVTKSILIDTNGVTTTTQVTFNADGSVKGSTWDQSTADGRSVTTKADLDGNGVYDVVATDVTTTDSANNQVETITVSSANGSVVGSKILITSADSLTQTLREDLDGDGGADLVTTQSIVLASDGSRTQTTSSRSANGALLDKTTTTISADRKSATTLIDLDGDNHVDRTISEAESANGTITTTVVDTSADGVRRSKSETSKSGNGLIVTEKLDVNGDGAYDITTQSVTTIGSDSSRTTTVEQTSGNGALIAKSTSTTSANGLSTTSQTDADGDGAYEAKTTDVTVLNADGSKTRTVAAFAGTSLTSRSITTTSGNGLISTVQADLDGNGTIDQTTVVITALAADGSRSETMMLTSSGGQLLGKTVTTTDAHKTVSTISADSNGDGQNDYVKTTTLAADGTTSVTEEYFNANGSIDGKTLTTASANGLSKTKKSDVTGDGVYDLIETDVTVLNADGSKTKTVSTSSANGRLISKATSTTSANGLTTTTLTDSTGDGVVDWKVIDQTTLGADGSQAKTITTRSSNGSLLAQKTTVQSGNGRTTTTATDANGDGAVDSTEITVLLDNGSVERTTKLTATSGALISQKKETVSADGLIKTIQSDIDGDGTYDAAVAETTVLNSDGSRKTTTQWRTGNGALTASTETNVSRSGLATTTSTDFNGDGVVDASSADATTLNADGSKTRSISNFDGANGLKDKTTVTTSANGYSVITASDLDGNGTTDRTSTAVRTLAVDGSIADTTSVVNGSGHLISKTTSSTSANKKTINTQYDLDGDGSDDVVKSAVLNADGSTTETISTYSGVGTSRALVSRSTTTTSANGLVVTAQTDGNGDGTIDRSSQTTTVLNADGSKSQTFVNFGPGGAIKDKSIVNTSANGLAISTQWLANGTIVSRSLDDVTTLNADGSTVRTQTLKKAGGAVESITQTTTSRDKKRVTTEIDLDGDYWFEQQSVSVVAADGSITTTSFDNPPPSSSVQIPFESGIDFPHITEVWFTPANLSGPNTLVIVSDSFFDEYTVVLQDQFGIDIGYALFQPSEAGAVAIIELPDGLSNAQIVVSISYLAGGNFHSAEAAVFQLPSPESLSSDASGTRKIVTISADGLTITTDYDTNDDGTVDKRVVEKTVLNADGSKTATITRFNGTSQAVERTVIVTSADGKTRTDSYDLNADSIVDRKEIYSTSFGQRSGFGYATTETMETIVAGATVSRYQTTTSGNGRSILKEWDVDGNGSVDQTATETIAVTDQGTVRTLAAYAGSTKLSSTTTTTSNDGRTETTVEERPQPGFSNRTITTSVAALADGSTVEKKTFTNTTNGVVEKQVTTTSADGREVTIERDIDGNGTVDQLEQRTKYVDGSTKTVITGSNSKTTFTTSADGLSSLIEWDMELDGNVDRRRVVVNKSNADGSQSSLATDYKMVAGSADKRVKVTSSTVSADGRSRSMSVDTNGDGVFDKVALTTIDASGGSVTTTTNNTEAQKADNLVLGEIYWKQAIAAKVITTVSSDGVTTTEQSDFDGNGTYEVTAVSRTRIDGSAVTEYTEVNATGAIIAKGTLTVSNDGRTKIFTKDADNNGIIDRKETTELFIEGQVVRRVVDYNPDGSIKQRSDESILANGDLAHSYVWNAANQKTSEYIRWSNGTATQYTFVGADEAIRSTHNLTKEGKLASGVFYDPKGTDPWIRIEQSFNAEGNKTLEKHFMDDGTRIDITFNAGTGKQTDAKTYDTSNRLIAAATYSNGLLSSNIIYDAAGTKPWYRVDQTFNASEQKTLEKQFMDDGTSVFITFEPISGKQTLAKTYDNASRLIAEATYINGILATNTFYDPANAKSWSRVKQTYTSDGTKVSLEQQFMDDGTLTNTTFDVANTQTWASNTERYDAAGRNIYGDLVFDNGTKYLEHRDPANAQTWRLIAENYNAAGQITAQTQYNDDGSRWSISWDRANAEGWSYAVNYYDTAGRYIQQTLVYDNGSRRDEYIDATNAAAWSNIYEHRDTAGRVESVYQYNDNGTKVITGYDTTSSQPWTWNATYFNASGGVTNYEVKYDDGTRYYDYRDIANSASWSTISQNFSSSGALKRQQQANDDGSSSVTDYAVTYEYMPGYTVTYEYWTKFYNASGQLIQEVKKDPSAGIVEKTWYGGPIGATYQSYVELSYVATGALYHQATYYAGTSNYDWVDHDPYNQYSWSSYTKIVRNGSIVSWKYVYDDGRIATGPTTGGGGGGHGPVALDLDFDGKIEIQTLRGSESLAGPRFDWNGDGLRDQTSWVGSGDGFLAIDLGQDGSTGPDGKIDQAKELAFNLWVETAGGSASNATDLQALGLVFDANRDSALDSKDLRWSEFRIWRDANQNGITDTGELQTLAEAGITRIALAPDPEGAASFSDGSEISGTSWFEVENGTRNLVGDVKLVSRPVESNSPLPLIDVNPSASSMPANARVDSLVAAMASFAANSGAGASELQNKSEPAEPWKQSQLAASSGVWSAA